MASSTRRTNLQRQIDQYERRLEEQAQKIVQEELNRLFRAVQLKVRRVGRMRPGIGAPRLRLHKAEVVNKTSMWQIFLDRMMSRLIEALLSGYITLQGLIAMRVTGEPLELDTDLIAQSLQSQLATRITHTTKTLKREVGRKIVSWYNTPGMTNQDIIKQLQPAFGAARASLISRTEITRLDALVQENTARQLGIDEWWWMTKRDQLVCKRPINGPDGKRYNGCRDLHGKVFNIGDKMPPDGSHPGCRCKAILISKPKPSVNDTPIVDISHLTKADFEESEHPRDKDGKFTDKAGAGASVPNMSFKRKFANEPNDRVHAYKLVDNTADALAAKWDVDEDAINSLCDEEFGGRDITGDKKKAYINRLLVTQIGGGVPIKNLLFSDLPGELKNNYQINSEGQKKWAAEHPREVKALQSLGNLIYSETQKLLQEHGVKSLHLYRLGGSEKDLDKPITSWSVNGYQMYTTDTTRNKIEMDIPAERILSTPFTGFGNIAEGEVLVIGAPAPSKAAEPGHELSTATSKISKLSTKYKLPQYEIVETKLPKGEFGHHTKSTVMVDIDNIRESLKSPKYDVKEWFGISDDSLESVVLNTVLHEIGHEWYRNASKKSEDLVLLPSGNKGRVETSPVIRSWNEIYDKAKISGHSAYYKLPHESFADAFALYMTGEDLPELVENWFNDNIEVRGEVRKADFEESEHPRDEDGKFTDKGSGAGKKTLSDWYKPPKNSENYGAWLNERFDFKHKIDEWGLYKSNNTIRIRDSYVVNDERTLKNNASLRDGNPPTNWAYKIDTLMTTTMREDGILYRAALLDEKTINKMVEAGGFIDKGFMSTSGDREIVEIYASIRENQFKNKIPCIFTLKTKAGQNIGIMDIGEFVLPRDTKIVIHGSKMKDGKCEIDGSVE